jgi:hypothetical protein
MSTEPEWTEDEQRLIEASRAYFEAIAAVAASGGRSQEAILAAMPQEVRDEMPMLDALGLTG